MSDYDLDVVLGFSKGQLEGSGTPSPALRLELPNLSDPIGPTFDGQDRLWIAEATGGTLAFSRRVLMATRHPSSP